MIDELKTQDIILGGGAFIAGLLIADLFKPTGGCGCSGGDRPEHQLTNESIRVANARQIGPAADTLGGLDLLDKQCRSTPAADCWREFRNGSWVCVCRWKTDPPILDRFARM